MIEQERAVRALRHYVEDIPGADLLAMFDTNETRLSALAPEISARWVIAGLLCDEVERKWGMDGISRLINCGRSPDMTDNFLAVIDEYLSINRGNFNHEVRKLIDGDTR